jgi:tetratricopeptide (TPR) repeat protein
VSGEVTAEAVTEEGIRAAGVAGMSDEKVPETAPGEEELPGVMISAGSGQDETVHAGDTADITEAAPIEPGEIIMAERPRSREELVAEIEARLRELEQLHQVAGESPEGPLPAEEAATQRSFGEAESHITEAPVTSPSDMTGETPENEADQHEEQQQKYEFMPEPVPGPETGEGPESPYEPVAEVEHEEEELLELIDDEQGPGYESQLSQADLIDRFIRINPTIERLTPGNELPVTDLSVHSSDEHGKFITETLAKIYLNQGYYTKAINIYEKLSLQYPEKSTYFASRIEKIKELIK